MVGVQAYNRAGVVGGGGPVVDRGTPVARLGVVSGVASSGVVSSGIAPSGVVSSGVASSGVASSGVDLSGGSFASAAAPRSAITSPTKAAAAAATT